MIRNDAEFSASHAEEARRTKRIPAPAMRYEEDGEVYLIPTTVAAVRDVGPGLERMMGLALSGECSEHELTIGLICRPEDMKYAPVAALDHLGDPGWPGNEVTAGETAACLATMDGSTGKARLIVVIGSRLGELHGPGVVMRAAEAVTRQLAGHRKVRGQGLPVA